MRLPAARTWSGVYPNDDALIRLAAGLLVEVNDEWLVAHRYISQASMQLILPELGKRTLAPNSQFSKERWPTQAMSTT